MEFKSKLLDEGQMSRSLARIAHEIIEKNNGAENICLLGIKRRGIPLAEKLKENIEKFSNISVPCGKLDITFYRDDLKLKSINPETNGGEIPINVEDYIIILVDDVIYTGRTAKAAIDLVFEYGRPKEIQLAVLIDRGHRELPIRPDYVGKNIPTSRNESVKVMVDEYDGKCEVSIYEL